MMKHLISERSFYALFWLAAACSLVCVCVLPFCGWCPVVAAAAWIGFPAAAVALVVGHYAGVDAENEGRADA